MMRKIFGVLLAASAAFFFASAALAQGTVTNHAFAIGKGAGVTGYTSLLCTSAQLAVGQSSADPICRTITGDVTLSAAGATTIGATKVTSAMLNADVFSTAHTWAGQQTFVAPILGTPASGTLTNATGLPIATGVSGLGTGVATFLGTPSSANLAAALTDETGTGAAVFAGSPTFTGTASFAVIDASTGYRVSGAATSGNYLRGNGTNFVSAAIAAGDLPLIPNTSGSTSASAGAVKVDGTTITASSGVLTAVGAAATSVAIGTTTISSGTSGRVIYDNAGVLGEATVTGSLGSVVLSAGPTFTGTSTFGVIATSGSAADTLKVGACGSTTSSVCALGLLNSAGTQPMCWNSSNGNFTSPSAGGCTTSALRFKNIEGPVLVDAGAALDRLNVVAGYWKDQTVRDNKEHVWLIADEVAAMDDRCGVYEDGQIQTYDDRCVLAYLVKANQQLRKEVNELKRSHRR